MAELNAPVASARAADWAEDVDGWRPHSAVVSWSAVFAGAVAAAAFGLILLTLGTGLGLAALSPWHSAGKSATAFGFAAIVWVCVTQILTSGLGGYLAGRLRHRWPAVEMDEVYFRDTAHGFLAWALATLTTAALAAAILPAAEHAGAQAVEKAAATAPVADRGDAKAAMDHWPVGYFVDSLFRRPAAASVAASAAPSAVQPSAAPAIASPAANTAASDAASASAPASAAPVLAASQGANADATAGTRTASGSVISPVATPAISSAVEPGAATNEPGRAGEPPKQEVTRIFVNSLATDDPLSVADTAYVANIVSRYTGLAPQAAQLRVAATYGQLQQKVVAMEGAAKVAADRARHASASAALWLFVALLLGAFSASFMAIFGGRLRDV